MYANFIVGIDNIFQPGMDESMGPALVGPTVQFSLPNLPTNYTFVTNILIGNIDLTKENRILARMFRKDNENNIIFELDTELPQSDNPNDTDASINFSGEVRNAYFESAGEYRCIVYINGELLCDTPLYITKEIKEV